MSTISERDRAALSVCVEILDRVGRTTQRSNVAVNSIAAAELLAGVGITSGTASQSASDPGEYDGLRKALSLLGDLSDETLGAEHVMDALHHVLLAYTAAA